ncbi:BRI1-5 ENHANCED 1 [Hibiscus trionum]|uniref:BRI1-5 ENHANCED 1 n=1 Tax=Hibiscus trionum TaxID=183268 RepID=A0A9W7HNU7_HIBTR|nr:BRI1-5 ENHANCED 1 [Hibiscus trionum]
MEDGKGTVCVTGGTGFVASWLIKRLLEEGYSVRATVRADPGNKRDLSFLTNLPGAAERLKIFIADLNDPDSFDAAIEGSKGVFHVATPLEFDVPEEVFIETAINGTLGILKACLKSSTVKRVVYTSSQATVIFNGRYVETMDETFWTDVDLVREKQVRNQRCYSVSKTLAERAALEFGARNGLDIVTVIPSLVVGPFVCPKFPGSLQTTLSLLIGLQRQYQYLLNVSTVHVDDLARAHIFLLEHPDATGRYNCSSNMMSLQNLYEFFRAKYPEFPLPTAESIAEIKGEKYPGLSSKKLLEIGFEFNSGVEEMFDDAVKCCKEKGYL